MIPLSKKFRWKMAAVLAIAIALGVSRNGYAAIILGYPDISFNSSQGAGANTFTSGAGIFYDSSSGLLSASAKALSITYDGINYTPLTNGTMDYRMDLVSSSLIGPFLTATFGTDGVLGPDLILTDNTGTLLTANFDSFTIFGPLGGTTASGEGYLTVTGGSLFTIGDFVDFAGLVHFEFQIGAPPGFNVVSNYSGRVSGDIAPAPEPGSMLLLGSGLSALGIYMRRRRNKA